MKPYVLIVFISILMMSLTLQLGLAAMTNNAFILGGSQLSISQQDHKYINVVENDILDKYKKIQDQKYDMWTYLDNSYRSYMQQIQYS